MGLGGTFLEDFIVELGLVVTDRMARYHIPTIQHISAITIYVVEH
jgi:CO/xanthine dehydrogenase Mo-binding subunit